MIKILPAAGQVCLKTHPKFKLIYILAGASRIVLLNKYLRYPLIRQCLAYYRNDQSINSGP